MARLGTTRTARGPPTRTARAVVACTAVLAAGRKGDPDRIPSEFQYWTNLDAPWARRARRVLHWIFGVDPILPDAIVREFARAYYDADPVAEAFVDDVYMTRGQKAGRAMLDRAIEHGVAAIADAPASLVRLFGEIETRPAWLDVRKMEHGARVFRRWGTHLYSLAGAITCEGYQECSVAKPLAFTGAYTGESANRRFLETAQFWIDVSEPGGLERGGRGVQTCLRVRIMHVFVRRRLLAHPAWDLAAWGVPISQADAMLTLLGGSFIPGYLLKLLGYRNSREDIEATLHFWRYVGHLVGVQPRWYPDTIEDALGLAFTSQVKGVRRAGDDAKHLARSYLASYAPAEHDRGRARLAKAWDYRRQLGFVSLFLPARSYREYDLPRPGIWRVLPALDVPEVLALETVRRWHPSIDAWVDARARNATKRWVRTRLGERTAEYRAVESFTR
ncbi:MAG: DUF2236 domain-containing protein [Deltaproteobacteria bacterium]|nr:DUF2236 domain-containing protein [Deltaproteobacteria bacterium]